MNWTRGARALRNCSGAPAPRCLAAAAALLLGSLAGAYAQLAPPASGLINPRAIAFSSTTGKVYAVATGHHAIDIYTAAADRPHRVAVGSEPVSLAVNTGTGRVYVANSGDGTVSVVDPESDAVTATIQVGSHPYSVAADPATGNIFVTHTFGNQTSVIEGASNLVTQLDTGSADLIAVDSLTRAVYLLGYGGAVTVLDEATRKFSRRDAGLHAWALTLDEGAGVVYVARIEDASLAAIAPARSEPIVIPAGAIPCAIAIDPKRNLLYVANYGDDTVTVIDSRTGRAAATLAVGKRPRAIAFDAVLGLVYVANTGSNSVTVIDAASLAVLATLPSGKSPYALAVVPGSPRLYVADESDEQASTVVDLSGLSVGNRSLFPKSTSRR